MNGSHYFALLTLGCLFVFAQVLDHRPIGETVDFGYVLAGLSILVALWLRLEVLHRSGVVRRIYLDNLGRIKHAWSYVGWLARAGALGVAEWRKESDVPDCATWFDTTGKKSRLPGGRVHADKGPL